MLRPQFALILCLVALTACHDVSKTYVQEAPPADTSAQDSIPLEAPQDDGSTPKVPASPATPKANILTREQQQTSGDQNAKKAEQEKVLDAQAGDDKKKPEATPEAPKSEWKPLDPKVIKDLQEKTPAAPAPQAEAPKAPLKEEKKPEAKPEEKKDETTNDAKPAAQSEQKPQTPAPADSAQGTTVQKRKDLKRVKLVPSSAKNDECTVRGPHYTQIQQHDGVFVGNLLGIFRDEKTTDAQKKAIAWYLKLDSIDKVAPMLEELQRNGEHDHEKEWIANFDKCEDMAKFARLIEEKLFAQGPAMLCSTFAKADSPIFMEHLIRMDRDGHFTVEVTENHYGSEPSKRLGSIQVVLQQSSNTKCPIAFVSSKKTPGKDGISAYKMCLKNWSSPKPGDDHLGEVQDSVSLDTTDRRNFHNWKHDCRQEEDFKTWVDAIN